MSAREAVEQIRLHAEAYWQKHNGTDEPKLQYWHPDDGRGFVVECPLCRGVVRVYVGAGNFLRVECPYCSPRGILDEFGMDGPRIVGNWENERVDRKSDEELEKLKVRERAKERFAAEKATVVELPAAVGLTDFLAQPDDEQNYLINEVFPTGGKVVVAAPNKAGKTTLRENFIRAVVDGEPFLGRFGVPDDGKVVTLVDAELSEGMLRRWLRDQKIVDTHAVEVLSMRGKLSTFNILDPTTRSRWANQLYGTDVLVLDCLRPFLDALGLSEDKDAGRFLEALDELAQEAQIFEMLVIHHTGHAGERARGDSRILDWPDAVWKLAVDDKDAASRAEADRYFSAYGRDVDVPQSLLGFDPETRRLTIAGGSKARNLADDALNIICDVLGKEPGLSQRDIITRLGPSGYGHTKPTTLHALDLGLKRGLVRTETGPRRSLLHYLNDECTSALGVIQSSECASDLGVIQSSRNECASALIGERTHSLTQIDDEPAHSNDEEEVAR